MTPVFTVTDAPNAAASAVISDGLSRYNREQAGYWDSRPLAVLVSDADTTTAYRFLTWTSNPLGVESIATSRSAPRRTEGTSFHQMQSHPLTTLHAGHVIRTH